MKREGEEWRRQIKTEINLWRQRDMWKIGSSEKGGDGVKNACVSI